MTTRDPASPALNGLLSRRDEHSITRALSRLRGHPEIGECLDTAGHTCRRRGLRRPGQTVAAARNVRAVV